MWVNKDKYGPAKRHYFPIEEVIRVSDPNATREVKGALQHQFTETTGVKSLCGQMPLSNKGSYWIRDGKVTSKWGGLSAVANPNLNQRNLCSYCVKKYVTEVRPELAEAYNILKGAK
jgi:hypothetical protein